MGQVGRRMTILVQQRTTHDCALACLAMLTAKTWDEIDAIVGHLVSYTGERCGMRDEGKALELLGFKNGFEGGHPVGDYVRRHRCYSLSAEAFRDSVWGRRALLSVPSLNHPGGWHMVYYDGRDLFDPSTAKTYASFWELRPDEITMFREAE